MISREEAMRRLRQSAPAVDHHAKLRELLIDLHAAGLPIEKAIEHGYLCVLTIFGATEAAKLIRRVSEELNWDHNSQMLARLEVEEGNEPL